MRKTPLKRKTRLRNKGGSRFPKQRDYRYLAHIRTLPCDLEEKEHCQSRGYRAVIKQTQRGSSTTIYFGGRTEAAHVIPKGRGSPDRKNVLPLCRCHHREQEGHNAEFEARHDISLADRANHHDAEYELGRTFG